MHKRAFEIDEASGEPALIQHIDSQGLHPRAFAIDATGSLLVAANLAPTIIEHDGSRRDVPAGLAMFRIGNDGLLSLVRTYPRRAAGIADPGLSPGRTGGTAIFARLSGGVDARDYPVRVAAKATQLPWGQDVDGERSHVCHVGGCRFGEYLEALLGQDGADGAPVCGIGLPADQTSPLEAGE